MDHPPFPTADVACQACYEPLRVFAASHHAWADRALPLVYKIRSMTVTADAAECQVETCESHKVCNEDHVKHDHGKDTPCSEVPIARICMREGAAGPNHICNCEGEDATVHQEILKTIGEIEKGYNEISNIAIIVRKFKPVDKNLRINPSIHCPTVQDNLRLSAARELNFAFWCLSIEPPQGRSFCEVWPTDKTHCHLEKMWRYAPADCACAEEHGACICCACVLKHVKHCAEDYKYGVGYAKELKAWAGNVVFAPGLHIGESLSILSWAIEDQRKAQLERQSQQEGTQEESFIRQSEQWKAKNLELSKLLEGQYQRAMAQKLIEESRARNLHHRIQALEIAMSLVPAGGLMPAVRGPAPADDPAPAFDPAPAGEPSEDDEMADAAS